MKPTQAACRTPSIRLSHAPIWFQLANVWLTISFQRVSFIWLFAPGGGFLAGLVLRAKGARAASVNFANARTLATGASAAILIGFTLLLGSLVVYTLRFWLRAPARLVPYFDWRLDAKSWGAFKKFKNKKRFALAQGFDLLERRASQLGVTPLSAFGFGDDLLGQARCLVGNTELMNGNGLSKLG